MRLTLRTLLAYMDDLLDPEDMRAIGEKIEESEFASGLVHRIRDVVRRSGLDAPKLTDRMESLDPNTVAEYLDNILPPDRVADFEKVCLDSDMELAEVAGCHQILTLVLGEPAEVSPESRARMYELPETASEHAYEEPPLPPTVSRGADMSADAAEPGAAPPVQSTVPDYLREVRRRRLRTYWIGAAVLLLGVIGVLGATGRLSGLFGTDDEVAPVAMGSPDDATPAEPGEPREPETPVLVSPEVFEPAEPEAPADVDPDAAVAEPVEPPVETPVDVPGAPENVVTVTPNPGVVPEGGVEDVPEGGMTEPAEGAPAEGAPVVPPPEDLAGNPLPVAGPDAGPDLEPMVPIAPEEAREVARLVAAEELALVAGTGDEPYYRIAASRPLRAGEHVVSLPTARPVLAYDNRLRVELVDGGSLLLAPDDGATETDLRLVVGRMILQAAPDAVPVTVQVDVGGVVGTLSLADPAAMVAVEVGRTEDPLEDPMTTPAPVTARLWRVSGACSWQAEAAAEATLLEGLVTVDLIGAPTVTAPVADVPAWVGTDMTSTLDRRAGGLLARTIQFDRSADLALREMTDHRQKETRLLSLRCLGWIDDFEPVVVVLNDIDRNLEWPDVIELLRAALRRDPHSAERVQMAMEVAFGPSGEELCELLWKYDVTELSRGQAVRLVQHLDSPTLAARVLSFWNLDRITGLGFYYRPEHTEAKRRQSVQRWMDWAHRQPIDETEAPPEDPGTNPTAALDPLASYGGTLGS